MNPIPKVWIIKDRFPHYYFAADGYWTPHQHQATRFRLRGAAEMALAVTMADRPKGMKRARVVRLVSTSALNTEKGESK